VHDKYGGVADTMEYTPPDGQVGTVLITCCPAAVMSPHPFGCRVLKWCRGGAKA